MDYRYRPKMSRLQRAKQFAPFDALDGLSVALEKVRAEHLCTEKVQLSEDQYDELNRSFDGVRPGDRLQVRYFEDGEYVTITGIMSGVDAESMTIDVGDRKVYMDSISEIRKTLFVEGIAPNR